MVRLPLSNLKQHCLLVDPTIQHQIFSNFLTYREISLTTVVDEGVKHVSSLLVSPTTAVAQSMTHWPNLRNSTVGRKTDIFRLEWAPELASEYEKSG